MGRKSKKFVPRKSFDDIEIIIKVNKQKVLKDVVKPWDVDQALKKIKEKLL